MSDDLFVPAASIFVSFLLDCWLALAPLPKYLQDIQKKKINK